MDAQQSLLDLAQSYFLEFVVPQAIEIDSNSASLNQALIGLGELGLLGLRVPQKWGGLEVSEEIFGNFQELAARYSGALAFLQTQHHSAVGFLTASNNSSLQQEYLPRMSRGEIKVGVGFSQLRRLGEPLIKATPIPDGYLLTGKVPWVTGWGLFQDFIVAASLPDGRAVFGMVPLVESYQDAGGVLKLSEPMPLAAMTATNTVSASFENWFLASDRIISIKPPGWIHQQDQKNILRPTSLILGCALASIDVLESTAINKSLPFIDQAKESLQQEINQCRNAIKQAQQKVDIQLTSKLQIRAWAIDLAVRCAHAAITVSSGAANSQYHAAQRIYREALVFTISGQTTAVMEATLNRLIRSPQPTKTITYSQIIHLSHVIQPNIPQWAGDPPVEFEVVAELEKQGYYLRRFSLGEHSATHINAPNSFYADGIAIDQYPAQSLILPAVVIDISTKAEFNYDYVLNVTDILDWERKHGEIPPNNLVLLYTGWQSKWSNNEAFFNQDMAGKMHFPGFSSEATKFLLQERSIAGVGIDTHGVDGGADDTFDTNCLVLEQPRIVLENLTNLEQLPPQGTTIVIGVIRLAGGSGSPVGVLALLP